MNSDFYNFTNNGVAFSLIQECEEALFKKHEIPLLALRLAASNMNNSDVYFSEKELIKMFSYSFNDIKCSVEEMVSMGQLNTNKEINLFPPQKPVDVFLVLSRKYQYNKWPDSKDKTMRAKDIIKKIKISDSDSAFDEIAKYYIGHKVLDQTNSKEEMAMWSNDLIVQNYLENRKSFVALGRTYEIVKNNSLKIGDYVTFSKSAIQNSLVVDSNLLHNSNAEYIGKITDFITEDLVKLKTLIKSNTTFDGDFIDKTWLVKLK